MPIFDAHVHYNQPPTYSIDEVREVFRRNAVTAILVSSLPNAGTHQLVDVKAQGLSVVPFIRPYVIESDMKTWFTDPGRWDLVESEFQRGYFRGIGEFHVFGEDTRAAIVKQVVDFAVKHDLVLHAHCDEAAVHILFEHDPRAKVIWAHAGFTTPAARIKELLQRYPNLWAELSFTTGITNKGKLNADWRELFATFPNRFMIGSDTWIDDRWAEYDAVMNEFRAWLAQLPKDQAAKISYDNAAGLFGLPPAEQR